MASDAAGHNRRTLVFTVMVDAVDFGKVVNYF